MMSNLYAQYAATALHHITASLHHHITASPLHSFIASSLHCFTVSPLHRLSHHSAVGSGFAGDKKAVDEVVPPCRDATCPTPVSCHGLAPVERLPALMAAVRSTSHGIRLA